MDKEIVAHLHISGKKDDILNFAFKWMEKENTILCEIHETPNNDYGMYSLISRF